MTIVLNQSQAVYTGIRGCTFMENLYPDYTINYTTNEETSFTLVFGVVFSGVTGKCFV